MKMCYKTTIKVDAKTKAAAANLRAAGYSVSALFRTFLIAKAKELRS